DRRPHDRCVLRVLRLEIVDTVLRSLGRQDDHVVDVLAAAHDSLRTDGARHDAARRADRAAVGGAFRRKARGGMSAAGPSQGANYAPIGGSAAAELANEAASVGVLS